MARTRGGDIYGNAPACSTARVGTPSPGHPRTARWRAGSPSDRTLRHGPECFIQMAPPRARGAPECPDGSPPGSPMPPQSTVSRTGTAPGGADSAPSDLECGSDSRSGRPRGAVAPHHPTPAPPLRAAASAQTAGPLSGGAPWGGGRGARIPPPPVGPPDVWRAR
jgi:hypothetical protein